MSAAMSADEPTWDLTVPMALKVAASHPDDVELRREMLDALGLVDWETRDENGRAVIVPDDHRVYELEHVNGGHNEYMGGRMGATQYEPPPRPENFSSPATLRHLPPPEIDWEEAAAPTRRVRGGQRRIDDACGSHTGRKRHQEKGEKLCDVCRGYYNAWQREYKARKRERAAPWSEADLTGERVVHVPGQLDLIEERPDGSG